MNQRKIALGILFLILIGFAWIGHDIKALLVAGILYGLSKLTKWWMLPGFVTLFSFVLIPFFQYFQLPTWLGYDYKIFFYSGLLFLVSLVENYEESIV